MLNRFTGKKILITGGNSGIGFATAKRIVSEGGTVIIAGRNQKTLRQAKEELGPNSDAIQCDVGDLKSIDAMTGEVGRRIGKLDGLFANAGIATFRAIEEVTEQEFDSMFGINVKGLFFTLQKAIPIMNSGSSVVVTSSVAGSSGRGSSSVYGATKAAVRSMARTFSGAYVSRGIRFNAVSPGPIDTPIWERSGGLPGESVEATKKFVAESNPTKRYGTAEEVAAAVAFLLSSESSYILGSELFVDGGVNQI